jgi:acyl carrier protein
MTEPDDTLHGCFAVAFPDLHREQIASAAVDNVADWDSLHAVVLVALIEEAFSIRIPARDYPELRSYTGIAEYLRVAASSGS